MEGVVEILQTFQGITVRGDHFAEKTPHKNESHSLFILYLPKKQARRRRNGVLRVCLVVAVPWS